jgi:hypothetical protein
MSERKKTMRRPLEESSETIETPVPTTEFTPTTEPKPDEVISVLTVATPLPSTVKVRVTTGTLSWERGVYEKGAVFEVPRKRALEMGSSVEILE